MLLPATLALLLLAFSMAPVQLGAVPLTPNVAWLATLVVSAAAPALWTRGLAFALGLLQDVLFATPLGSQALLALMLALLMARLTARRVPQPFRVRWAESVVALLVAHLVLWALMRLVQPAAPPPLSMVVYGTLASLLWYPLFDALFRMVVRRCA
jgi:rod shape-determining protein MreD